MNFRFAEVTVTAVCECGTQWQCRTARRADLPPLPDGSRIPTCPLCTPPTNDPDQ